MRFREDKAADLERARAAVAQWRQQHPAGTADQLTAAVGSQFHPDYGPVLRAMLFRFDEDHAGTTNREPAVSTWDVLTGSRPPAVATAPAPAA